jgi:hypothetical protein
LKRRDFQDSFPLLIPGNPADLSKVSNSNDKFRQTVGEIPGKEACLSENSTWNRCFFPWQETHSEHVFRDMSWIL